MKNEMDALRFCEIGNFDVEAPVTVSMIITAPFVLNEAPKDIVDAYTTVAKIELSPEEASRFMGWLQNANCFFRSEFNRNIDCENEDIKTTVTWTHFVRTLGLSRSTSKASDVVIKLVHFARSQRGDKTPMVWFQELNKSGKECFIQISGKFDPAAKLKQKKIVRKLPKLQFVAMKEVAYVFFKDNDEIIVESLEKAKRVMLNKGGESCCAAAHLVLNRPLDENKDFHKIVLSPVRFINNHGTIERSVEKLSKRQIESIRKGWDNPFTNNWVLNQLTRD